MCWVFPYSCKCSLLCSAPNQINPDASKHMRVSSCSCAMSCVLAQSTATSGLVEGTCAPVYLQHLPSGGCAGCVLSRKLCILWFFHLPECSAPLLTWREGRMLLWMQLRLRAQTPQAAAAAAPCVLQAAPSEEREGQSSGGSSSCSAKGHLNEIKV